MVAVKICGLSDAALVETAIAHGAAWVGLVHFAKSPRHVSVEQIAALGALAKGRVGRVAVLVNPDDALVRAIAPHVDVLQLHGQESTERAQDIKTLTGLNIWKAISISSALDFEQARAYLPVVDRLLFDAKPPKESVLPGGTGTSFDWALLQAWDGPPSWLLAGGLTAENLGAAVRISGARAVDLSSGLETAPGVKSAEKIKHVLRAAKALSNMKEGHKAHA